MRSVRARCSSSSRRRPTRTSSAPGSRGGAGSPSSGRRIVAIVATHHHPDHVGGVRELTRALDVPFWAHAETASRVGVPVARRLEDGDVIALDGVVPERWQVLHTPGHAPGHICLWNADERTVVVGDMVASVGTILINTVDGDMRAYLEQLDRLASSTRGSRSPRTASRSTGRRSSFAGTSRTGRCVKPRSSRRSPRGARPALSPTPEELLPEVYDDVPATTWPIALLSLQAHLKKLDDDGRAARPDAS